MISIPRFIIRWGLISGLALGGATLLIGPERVCAGLAHVRAKAQSVVDRAVDDPTALRRQLDELADEYPERIAVVRGEIAEVDAQVGQYDHDNEIAKRVVALTTTDLDELKTLIAKAEGVKAGQNGRAVAVRFGGVKFNLDDAYAEARRISHVRANYQDRVACNEQQMGLLNQQQARLTDIHTTLEDEYGTFQTQMWQLDRQIDAIARNEQLIKMTEQLQETLAGYDRWGEIGNLKQLEAKLAELRTIQEAKLQALAKISAREDYENRARFELENDSAPADKDPFADQKENGTDDEVEPAKSMAWLPPLVIE